VFQTYNEFINAVSTDVKNVTEKIFKNVKNVENILKTV